MKGQVYAIAVGVLTGQIFSIKQWQFYVTVIGIVFLANFAEWLSERFTKQS